MFSHHLQYTNFMVQGKNAVNKATDRCVCEPLMPDVVVPKVHQNSRSYVSSADLPSDHLAWSVVIRRTLKNHKTVKIGGGRLPGTIRYLDLVANALMYASVSCNHCQTTLTLTSHLRPQAHISRGEWFRSLPTVCYWA